MGAVEIIITAAAVVAFLVALGVVIYKKVKGKGGCCGCDCGCGGCFCCTRGNKNAQKNK